MSVDLEASGGVLFLLITQQLPSNTGYFASTAGLQLMHVVIKCALAGGLSKETFYCDDYTFCTFHLMITFIID